jgi:hypothetical protein
MKRDEITQPSYPMLLSTILRSANVFTLLLGYFTGTQILRMIMGSAEYATNSGAIGQFPLLVLLIVHIIVGSTSIRSKIIIRAAIHFVIAITATVLLTLVLLYF